MVAENLLLNFTRIFQQISGGIQRKLLAPHKIVLTYPNGLPYEAFDGSARVKPWHLLNLVESNRAGAFNQHPKDNIGSFVNFEDLCLDTYHFNVVTQLNISKEMYDTSFPKSPMDIFVTLHHVGKTSITLLTEAMHPCHPEPLFTNLTMSVSVDRHTRKSSPLPDSWMEKYKHLAEGQPIRMNPAARPDDPSLIGTHPVRVGAGDVDTYLHVNWATYLKYCHEGKVGAMLARGQKVTSRDLTMPVKSATLAYLQEGNLGDLLSVDHWKGEDGTWHFDVAKENRSVAQAAISYYDL